MFWTILLGLSLLSYEQGVGRVKVVRGDAMVLPYGADEWEYLFKNDVIGEGDIVKTLENSRVLFAFGRGNVVSVGENTEVEVNALDDNYNLRIDDGVMRIMSKDCEGTVEIMNTDVDIYSYSTVRVQRRGAMAKVSVIRGEAMVENETVRAGEMARIYPDGRIVIRREFNHDDFDRWAAGYERRYIVVREVEYIPDDIYIGVYDLENYGHWRYVSGYGWVWMPDVGPDWRPYYYGHWVFRVHYGWVWVSYEDWGWVPYHYGRWAWVPGIGWVWVPGHRWRGAWVVWYEGPSWVSWAPLDPYGRPIVYINYHGRRRYVAPVVDYASFRKPVYRYKPPTNGVYKKPVYRTKSVKLTSGAIRKYEKPVNPIVPSHIKPVYRKQWKDHAEKIIKNPQIVKKPIENIAHRRHSGIKTDVEKNSRNDRKPVVKNRRNTTVKRETNSRYKPHERESGLHKRTHIKRNKKDTLIRTPREKKRGSKRNRTRHIKRNKQDSAIRNPREKSKRGRKVDLPRKKVNNRVSP